MISPHSSSQFYSTTLTRRRLPFPGSLFPPHKVITLPPSISLALVQSTIKPSHITNKEEVPAIFCLISSIHTTCSALPVLLDLFPFVQEIVRFVVVDGNDRDTLTHSSRRRTDKPRTNRRRERNSNSSSSSTDNNTFARTTKEKPSAEETRRQENNKPQDASAE